MEDDRIQLNSYNSSSVKRFRTSKHHDPDVKIDHSVKLSEPPNLGSNQELETNI